MKPRMNWARLSRALFVWTLIVVACLRTAIAQTQIFTFQGRLTDGASPASDTYEMQFSLFGSPSGNDQIGSTISNSSVVVAGGVFTVQLDFSSATPFATGADRWLQIAVRKVSGPPGFTTLSPRQQITSNPYSIRSASTNAADSLSTVCVGCVTDSHVSDTLTLGPSSTVSDSALSLQVAHLNGAETITGDWINTANPWADNEVADALTINGGTLNNTVIGATTSAAGTFTTLSLNGGGGTNTTLSKSGVDRSSAVGETFNIQNSGSGAMTLQVDGATVVTTTNETFVNTSGDTMTGALNMNNNVISNIGSSGTDFTPTGALFLGDNLTLAAGETIRNTANTITFVNGVFSEFSLDLGAGSPVLSSSSGNVVIGDTLELQNGEVLDTATDATFTLGRNNAGTVTLTAKDDDTNADLTVQAGGTGTLTLGNGSAGVINFTSFDVASNGSVITGGPLTTGGPITTPVLATGSNTVLTSQQSVVLVSTATGPRTVTLPSAAGAVGRILYVFVSGGGNTLTIARAGTDSINDQTSVTVSGENNGVMIIGATSTTWIASRLTAED